MTRRSSDYNGTVVVIPTRNRAGIAMNAIRSVLDQPAANVQVLVSDNSNVESELEDLKNFCVTLADPRLRYIRPAQSLSMSVHWEWAIEQALTLYEVNHFTYLTDRMMFRSGALKEVMDLAALYPEKVISYNHDRIVDSVTPIRIEEYPGTGKLLEVQTLRFSYLFSQAVFSHGLPRMLNCIAPRSIFERMRERFGNVFNSICPDFMFCCRCLEMEDSVLFYDKSAIFHYALNRSNGASVTRGEMTSDNADFIANLPVNSSARNYATPIPQLITAVNAAFNEYLAFKEETNSPRFFAVDFQKYLRANAAEINEVADPQLRAEMLALLVANGYQEGTNQSPSSRSAAKLRDSILVWGKVKSRLKTVVTGPVAQPAWLFLARILSIGPPADNGFEFDEIEDAIDYTRNISRGNLESGLGQAELLQASQLPLQEVAERMTSTVSAR